MSQHEPNTITEYFLVEPNLEEYVKSKEFDRECTVQLSKVRERTSVSHYRSDWDYEGSTWSNSDDGISSTRSVSPVEPSPHEVPKYDRRFYYAGIGPGNRGPKLIYRTSDDKFVKPGWPSGYSRMMKLVPVPGIHELGQDGCWDGIRNQVVELLDRQAIKLTSVDLVRFTWLDKEEDHEIEEEEEEDEEDGDNNDDAQNDNLTYDDFPLMTAPEPGKRHTTNPTIWVGLLPDTLTGTVAHNSATEILGLLKELGIAGFDVAYRESVTKSLHGPELFAPVWDLKPLKDVIENLSTALSLPISGRKTTMQGTLGFYFRVGEDLYAATARHNVLSLIGDNEEYNYSKSVPKTKVVVMGKPAFTNYLASIQTNIAHMNFSIDYSERQIRTLTKMVEAGGDDTEESVRELELHQEQLTRTVTKIDALKASFVDVNKRWSKSKDRVIGYVVWAPPIGVGVSPHRYTRDLCVVKLDKKKFRKFRGNVLSLGPDISPFQFQELMWPDRTDVPSEFESPIECLLAVQGMLSAADINNPKSQYLKGERIHHIIKYGFATNTTVGTLSRYMSHTRKYFVTGNLDSVEVAILLHDKAPNDFSEPGDSGALIVDGLGRCVALLTGGTNKGSRPSDITFATPMEWVWDLIKDKFPGANLDFDDLEGFLADVV